MFLNINTRADFKVMKISIKMISYIKALSLLKASKTTIESENILSENSLNRISTKNVYTTNNFPSANNTAFDGYAINYLDIKI